MAIEAKVTFLNETEQKLSTVLTASDMSRVMSILADQLSGFDLSANGDATSEHDDLLDAYLNALAVQGRSNKTIERYRYCITRMREYLKIPTRSITVYHLRKYLAEEKGRGVADRTLEGLRQVFSAYFGWLQRERLIESNPTANLGSIKYQKKQKDIYSDVDIERMKFKCKSIRDIAIISFLKATGCRIGEVVRLNRDDVDLQSLECKVLGKGNKERIVFLDPVGAAALQSYLETRNDDYPALFVGKGTDRLKANGIRKILIELGHAANVEHVHPHKFRRTTATNLIRRGMPIQEVAAILGHDKLDTTMQYVVLDKSTMKNSYQKYA